MTVDGHDHGEHGQGAGSGTEGAHNHDALLEVPAVGAPGVTIELNEDPVSGWNLRVITENFRFSPEQTGGAHVANEGHAHVYVDGVKIGRLYGPWMHIATLPTAAKVEVTLNSNDHRAFSVDGKTISAAVSLPATN